MTYDFLLLAKLAKQIRQGAGISSEVCDTILENQLLSIFLLTGPAVLVHCQLIVRPLKPVVPVKQQMFNQTDTR